MDKTPKFTVKINEILKNLMPHKINCLQCKSDFEMVSIFGKNVIVGKHFVFLLHGLEETPLIKGLKRLFKGGFAPQVLSRWGEGKLEIPGVEIQKTNLLDVPLTSVFPTKDLYNTGLSRLEILGWRFTQ